MGVGLIVKYPADIVSQPVYDRSQTLGRCSNAGRSGIAVNLPCPHPLTDLIS